MSSTRPFREVLGVDAAQEGPRKSEVALRSRGVTAILEFARTIRNGPPTRWMRRSGDGLSSSGPRQGVGRVRCFDSLRLETVLAKPAVQLHPRDPQPS